MNEAKLEGLRQLLQRDGEVRFKATGATVRRDPDWPRDLLIDRSDGSTRRVNEFAYDQLGQAYALAMAEPEPPAPAPPKIKQTRSRTDFGDCPF